MNDNPADDLHDTAEIPDDVAMLGGKEACPRCEGVYLTPEEMEAHVKNWHTPIEENTP